jgi:hypothetical protein
MTEEPQNVDWIIETRRQFDLHVQQILHEEKLAWERWLEWRADEDRLRCPASGTGSGEAGPDGDAGEIGRSDDP